MPETTTVTNYLDFYRQQLVRSKDWFKRRAPLWDAIDEVTTGVKVSQRGVRLNFMKTGAGGHTLPTLSQPDNNRAIPPQSDSMWAVPQLYTIPMVIDLLLLNDAGGLNGREKAADAMFNIQDIIKQTTNAAAQRQDFFAAGDGTDAMAYSSASLAVVGAGQTLTCSTAASTAPGRTKGAVRLKQNQYYQSYDTTTGLPEGTILVTSSNNKTQATVTLLSGIVTSGNPICDVGGYNGAPMGISGLMDNTSRILQGRDTSVDTILNIPTIDLAGAKYTVSDRETIKTMLVVLNGNDDARSGLTNIVTPGLMSDLRKQGYGFHRTNGSDAQVDITRIYKDADGTRIMEIPSWEEDRSVFFRNDALQKHTELPFGDIEPNSNFDWKNLPGVNNTGSRNYYRFWGTCWTLVLTDSLGAAGIKRASLTGIITEPTTGIGN